MIWSKNETNLYECVTLVNIKALILICRAISLWKNNLGYVFVYLKVIWIFHFRLREFKS